MDYQAELSCHQTISEALRTESKDTVKTHNYWGQAAKIADSIAKRMEESRARGEEVEEIELRQFHGFAAPEFRKMAEKWRAKGAKAGK
jgi:hypothetical protein